MSYLSPTLTFNKPEARLLNKSSFIAPASGKTKVLITADTFLSHFDVMFKSNLGVQKAWLWYARGLLFVFQTR